MYMVVKLLVEVMLKLLGYRSKPIVERLVLVTRASRRNIEVQRRKQVMQLPNNPKINNGSKLARDLTFSPKCFD
jgi:hypothetical protein